MISEIVITPAKNGFTMRVVEEIEQEGHGYTSSDYVYTKLAQLKKAVTILLKEED